MSRTIEQIISIMAQRRQQDSTLIRAMIDVRDRYNGDLIVSLPDVSKEPNMKPPSPRLVADGIDGTAMRAASARPNIFCPAVTMTSDRSRGLADDRRRALYSAWNYSALWDVQLYRSYRHLIGYGTCAFIVMPEDADGRARVEIRDPLTAYPELRSPDDTRNPKNVGFVFGRSVDWITANFPESRAYMDKARGQSWDTLWDLVEWIDEDDVVIGILGPRQPAYAPVDSRVMATYGHELRRWKNKAGMVPGAVPRRVTLDRIAGQMTGIIPMADLLDRLNSLDIIAAERAIFPDMVAMGKDGRPPQLISGQWKDGRTGEVNLLTDSDVKLLTSAPGPLTGPVLDRLEKATRMSGGISSFFGGDTTGSLRTGRAIDSLGGYSVDPRIEEAQKVMARALMAVNEGIVAVEKGYYSGRKIVGFTGWATDSAVIEYQPEKVYENGLNIVTYDFPGSDVAQISVTVGQMVGADLMSKATGRRKHPYIEDPDAEEQRLVLEKLDNAIFQGYEQQAVQGTLPLVDAIRVRELVQGGKGLVEAFNTAHDEAQARQATQAPAPEPGQAGPPEGQPGLSQPGMGVEQPPAPIPAPSDSQQNLKRLIGALRSGGSE